MGEVRDPMPYQLDALNPGTGGGESVELESWSSRVDEFTM
jgi:hypothetical protein